MKLSSSENKLRQLETNVHPVQENIPVAGSVPVQESISLPEEESPAGESPRLFLIPAVLFLLGAILTGLFTLLRTEAHGGWITCELGEEVPTDPSAYLEGTDFALSFAKIDLTGVDETRPGSYPATVTCLRNTYPYTIVIKDTVAPEVTVREGPFYFEAGTELTPSFFLSDIRDADRELSVSFDSEFWAGDTYPCAYLGAHLLPVKVSDSSGNSTVVDVAFLVDLPPEIRGVQDIYLTADCDVDFLSNVTAIDLADGDVTGSIEVDESLVSLSVPGDYPLSYTVTDSYALTRTQTCTVHVDTAEHLQELISDRTINHTRDRIYGAPNVYDLGRFSGLSIEQVLRETAPASVQLYRKVGENGYLCGSGFLTEIREEGIYLCTNQHVIAAFSDWDVYFYDGTVARGTVLGTTEDYDIGVVFVPMEEIPEDLLQRISTVHIDETYWKSLDTEPLPLGLVHIGRENEDSYLSTGSLVKIHQEFSFFSRKDQTEVSVPLVHGDSGSAIVDGQGNLIAVSFAFSLEPQPRYWGVPLDAMLDSYEAITGRRPYTY